MNHKQVLLEIYQRLYQSYGPQGWWPADTPFEVMVGAILTQNTAWTNVEKAIDNLKQANALNTSSIIGLSDKELSELIYPSGFFNIKTKRLKNYVNWFVKQGRFNALNKLDDDTLRQGLLSVNGVGPETADDILLYAFERPVFVIDAYTRRLLLKLNLINDDESYEDLRQIFQKALHTNNKQSDVELFKEYHALIVHHAKVRCNGKDDCYHCHVESPFL